MLDATGMLQGLTEVGIALTSTQDLDVLLERIVTEARHFARCDGGSLYIREGDDLRLAVWQNETLGLRGGRSGEVVRRGSRMPADRQSIAGWVATSASTVLVEDAYDLPEGAPFRLDPAWDVRNQYRTRSVLAVPLHDPDGSLVGVLQLINALEGDRVVVPFSPELEPMVRSLASQAAVAVRNAQLHQELKDAHYETIVRLSVAAEFREPDTANHVQRVSRYAEVIGEALGLSRDEAEVLRFAAPMHDIGKLGVPDAVLLKGGPLTPPERLIMQEHTVIGHRILDESPAAILRASAEVAYTHHERWDGHGYPRRLRKEEIPLNGRIVAVVDALDCACSARVYKLARGFDEAVESICGDSGRHFDPRCVEALQASVADVRQAYEELCEGASPPQ